MRADHYGVGDHARVYVRHTFNRHEVVNHVAGGYIGGYAGVIVMPSSKVVLGRLLKREASARHTYHNGNAKGACSQDCQQRLPKLPNESLCHHCGAYQLMLCAEMGLAFSAHHVEQSRFAASAAPQYRK
jgi:hypothetical protein